MQRNGRSNRTETSSPSRFGPRRLAEFATARPGLVLSLWGLLAVIGIGLTAALFHRRVGKSVRPPTAIASASPFDGTLDGLGSRRYRRTPIWLPTDAASGLTASAGASYEEP